MHKPLADMPESRTFRLSPGLLDAAVLALTAPVLLATGWAPQALSVAALALLAVPFAVRWSRTRRATRPTPFNWPAVVLAFIFLPAALWLSPDPWAITWPRVTTLAWSLALFFAVANWPPVRARGRRPTRLNGPTWAFLALGGGLAVLTPLTIRAVDKLFYLPWAGRLAAPLGLANGLPTNEVAGVLALIIPLAVALACGALWTQRRRLLWVLLPLVALLLPALLLTQSRTGLTATAVGVLVALVVGARPRWQWLAAGLGVVALLALLVVLSPLRDWFVFAGANSWQSVVGPRVGIWGQALDGIRDHPVWGMGLGAFGVLARLVYPLAPPAEALPIEDAHNLYLQTALDFGVAGALLLVYLLGLAAGGALGLARARPARSLSRLWAAGLLGALTAHALYSLTDAVALGTPGGVALWFVFGLVMGGHADAHPSAAAQSGPAVEPFRRWSPLASGLAAVALLAVLAAAAWPVNRAGQLAGQALLDADRAAPDAAELLTAARCRAGWYEGLVHQAGGDLTRRAAVWAELLGCAQEYTGYMAVLAADDEALARRALATQPDNPSAHFWLAAVLAPAAPDEAIALYRSGLALDPRDGRRWLRLADLLVGRDDAAALEAFLQACHHGDPGANGCARAAEIVAAQGDLETAIRYYRLSNWSEARARAEELERRLAGE